MTDSFRALCNDFYVNQKLSVKMDLPGGRETVLDLFERVRKAFPKMDQFKRYKDELALESSPDERPQRWLAIRSSNIRSGVVNPESADPAYGLHRKTLEIAPYFLSISPLDIDYLELLFGFDLAASGNHDQIVYDAVLAETSFASLLDLDTAHASEAQPLFGVTYGAKHDREAHVEIKTRSTPREGELEGESSADPISVYLTVRRYGPFRELDELPEVLESLAREGEAFVESSLAPSFLSPIRSAIAARGG
ncbi:MAG: hypothetical protein AAGB51_09635 [Planctomycetota bacterium]